MSDRKTMPVYCYLILIKPWWSYNQAETKSTVFSGAPDEFSPILPLSGFRFECGFLEGSDWPTLPGSSGAGFDTRSARGTDLAIGSDSRRPRNRRYKEVRGCVRLPNKSDTLLWQ